ncbi:MAG: kappa-carrageenase [Verrucomicrobiota bacterium]
MKRPLILATLLPLSALAEPSTPVPTGVPGAWIPLPKFTDEFNAPEIDRSKWNHRLSPWGERAWRAKNVVQENGVLKITARHEPHQHRGKQYFYTMGIFQSQRKVTYGFFEARIKACSRFPGMAPAFWLYSNGRSRNPAFPKVTYSEVDIVELLQGNFSTGRKNGGGPKIIDCNLHTRIIDDDGREIWQRPNSLPEVCKHQIVAPWDPRDDFHIYAAEVSPEKIIWYIDGKKVAEEQNLYWHLPMNLTLTMEARPPLIRWAGEDGREPVPEAATAEGFPTHMTVDYVRSWVRK